MERLVQHYKSYVGRRVCQGAEKTYVNHMLATWRLEEMKFDDPGLCAVSAMVSARCTGVDAAVAAAKKRIALLDSTRRAILETETNLQQEPYSEGAEEEAADRAIARYRSELKEMLMYDDESYEGCHMKTKGMRAEGQQLRDIKTQLQSLKKGRLDNVMLTTDWTLKDLDTALGDDTAPIFVFRRAVVRGYEVVVAGTGRATARNNSFVLVGDNPSPMHACIMHISIRAVG